MRIEIVRPTRGYKDVKVLDGDNELVDGLSGRQIANRGWWESAQQKFLEYNYLLNLSEDEIFILTWLFVMWNLRIDPIIIHFAIDAIAEKKKQDVRKILKNLADRGFLFDFELYPDTDNPVIYYSLKPILHEIRGIETDEYVRKS